jgi:hypothetical protein
MKSANISLNVSLQRAAFTFMAFGLVLILLALVDLLRGGSGPSNNVIGAVLGLGLMMIGQVMLHLSALYTRMERLEREIAALRPRKGDAENR